MNGVAGPYGHPPPAPVAWQEARTPDGRSYYYNSITKVTQWTKPEDLMGPAEVSKSKLALPSSRRLAANPHASQRALANQPWKEYTAEGGRKYWYNTETKQSSWEMPEVYRQALGVPSGPSTPA